MFGASLSSFSSGREGVVARFDFRGGGWCGWNGGGIALVAGVGTFGRSEKGRKSG